MKSISKIGLRLLFSILYLAYFLVVLFLFFNNSFFYKGLMFANFFINSVVFVVFSIYLILDKYITQKKKIPYILLGVIPLLIFIYFCGYYDIKFLVRVSDVLVYFGLLISWTTIPISKKIILSLKKA